MGVVWAYTLAAVITALVAYWMWRRATPQLRNIAGHFESNDLLHSSMPLFWMAFMSLLMHWTATLMLGVWGSNAEVGIFNVASRTAILTSFILTAINSIAAPQFAILYKQGDIEALGFIARSCAKLMVLIASPILLLFIIAPRWVLGLFGPQFVEGSAVLAILSITQFFNAAAGSVGPMLMMTGNERSVRNSMVAGALTSLVLNVLLIPCLGIIGAAAANGLSLVLVNVICLWEIHRCLGISLVVDTWLIKKT
jgi:O-antigen/teichoic acid export membrane protein